MRNSKSVQLGFMVLLLVAIRTTDVAGQVSKEKEAPPALTHYMGRKIAWVSGGPTWLIRDNRQEEENSAALLKNLKLKPGMTVCDMGCGNGYYTLQMAKLIEPKGKVLAVDIQIGMLQLLQERADKQEITNIKPILSTVIDPKLPKNKVDLILCVDVYHEFSHPEQMLKSMRDSLAPGGVIALAEYREEDPLVPIKPLHKMSKKQIMKEYKANGFKLVRQYDELPWQHLMYFGRDDDKTFKALSETKTKATD